MPPSSRAKVASRPAFALGSPFQRSERRAFRCNAESFGGVTARRGVQESTASGGNQPGGCCRSRAGRGFELNPPRRRKRLVHRQTVLSCAAAMAPLPTFVLPITDSAILKLHCGSRSDCRRRPCCCVYRNRPFHFRRQREIVLDDEAPDHQRLCALMTAGLMAGSNASPSSA